MSSKTCVAISKLVCIEKNDTRSEKFASKPENTCDLMVQRFVTAFVLSLLHRSL